MTDADATEVIGEARLNNDPDYRAQLATNRAILARLADLVDRTADRLDVESGRGLISDLFRALERSVSEPSRNFHRYQLLKYLSEPDGVGDYSRRPDAAIKIVHACHRKWRRLQPADERSFRSFLWAVDWAMDGVRVDLRFAWQWRSGLQPVQREVIVAALKVAGVRSLDELSKRRRGSPRLRIVR